MGLQDSSYEYRLHHFTLDLGARTEDQIGEMQEDILPLLTCSNNIRYRIDAPTGTYMTSAGANWITQEGYAEEDASYKARLIE
jgi:hypothetical protein